MPEVLGIDHRVNGEGGLERKIPAPVDRVHSLIHIVGTMRLKLADRLEHPQRRAQAEVGPVHHGQVAGEAHHSAALLHILGTQGRQLAGKDLLQALQRLGNHLKFIHILYFTI